MQISADATLLHPRPLVYAAYRDELLELLAYLPNVRGIELKSRESEGLRTHFVNVWRGGGEIPAVARAFVSEAMLSVGRPRDLGRGRVDLRLAHRDARLHRGRPLQVV
jgi:hypothetical protein